MEGGAVGHNFERDPPKDHPCQVWMVPFQNCVRWSRLPTKMATKLKIEKGEMKCPLLLCWLKCEKLTDGRTTDDGCSVVTIAHLTLWVRWAKNIVCWRKDILYILLNFFKFFLKKFQLLGPTKVLISIIFKTFKLLSKSRLKYQHCLIENINTIAVSNAFPNIIQSNYMYVNKIYKMSFLQQTMFLAHLTQ
jgi:hypothetical protein